MDDLFARPAILVPLATAGVALLWCFASFVAGHVSGWTSLARAYRAWSPFTGTSWIGQSGYVGGLNYNGCLNVGCDDRGLSLSLLLPFRVGHPPLFFPWEDVSVSESRIFFVFTLFELRFRKAPRRTFSIRPRLAERLRAAAGPRWPASSSSV